MFREQFHIVFYTKQSVGPYVVDWKALPSKSDGDGGGCWGWMWSISEHSTENLMMRAGFEKLVMCHQYFYP